MIKKTGREMLVCFERYSNFSSNFHDRYFTIKLSETENLLVIIWQHFRKPRHLTDAWTCCSESCVFAPKTPFKTNKLTHLQN